MSVNCIWFGNIQEIFLELHQSFEVNTGEFEGNIRGDIIKKTLEIII